MSDRRRVFSLDIVPSRIPALFRLADQMARHPISESDFMAIGWVTRESIVLRFHSLILNRQVLILKFGPESDFKISP